MTWRADFDWAPSDRDAVADLPDGFAEAFVASMPPRYAVLFDPRSIRRHALIAHRRGASVAYAEVWRALADGSAALCVVAEDRPGLLSAIAAALVSHRLDVITALVFSRVAASGEPEAVDFLWVRRAGAADTSTIGADEAGSVGQVLSAILTGSVSVEQIASRALTPVPSGEGGMVVRFDATDEQGRAVLLVEAHDRPGMLLTITRELFQQGDPDRPVARANRRRSGVQPVRALGVQRAAALDRSPGADPGRRPRGARLRRDETESCVRPSERLAPVPLQRNRAGRRAALTRGGLSPTCPLCHGRLQVAHPIRVGQGPAGHRRRRRARRADDRHQALRGRRPGRPLLARAR